MVCPPTPFVSGNKSVSRSPFATSKKNNPSYTTPDFDYSLDRNSSPVERNSTPTFQTKDTRLSSTFSVSKTPFPKGSVRKPKRLTNSKNPFSDDMETDDSLEIISTIETPYFLKFFQTIRPLGDGSYGSVLLCKHRLDGWIYAIKKIKYRNRNESETYLHEVFLLAAIGNHPHFIRYYNSWNDEEENTIYIQTEYCNGGSLITWFQDRKLKTEELYEILRQIGTSLNYLHNVMKCVHMDIKPANIFVSKEKDGRIIYKLGDFGRSRKISEDPENIIDTDEIDGDGRFMAPELLTNYVSENMLSKADIYSLAVSILNISGVERDDNNEYNIQFADYFDRSLAILLQKMTDPDPMTRISSAEMINDPLLIHPEIRNVKDEIELMFSQYSKGNNVSTVTKHMSRIPSFELGHAIRNIRDCFSRSLGEVEKEEEEEDTMEENEE